MARIDTVEGIGPAYAAKLRDTGVRTVGALLDRGAAKKGRQELAQATGISERLILEWVNRADLMRVRGVGEEYSDLLEAAGVDTVKELAARNPGNLHKALAAANASKNLVRRIPSPSMVERWVAHAKKLPQGVFH